MKYKNQHLLTPTFFLLILLCSPLQAETLRFSIAASMTDVFKELITNFGVSHPDIHITANYGPSGGLAKQIHMGAPADLYISANPKWMDYLIDEKRIVPKSMRIFAYNSLVFIGRNDLQMSSLSELITLEKIGIGSPRSVPVGQYARQALSNEGLYEQLASTNKLVMAKDARQALIYADRGETDGSFVYKTDAVLAKNATVLFEIPPHLHDKVSYPIGLTVEGAQKNGAQMFYNFITTPEAHTVLRSRGFSIPD